MTFQKMKQNSKVAFRRLRVSLAAEYPEEVINGIYNAASQAQNSLKKTLTERADEITSSSELSDEEKHILLDDISDDYFLSKQTTGLASEMRIVAFYKTIEIAIKEMLTFSELFTNKQLENVHKVEDLKKMFKNKICDMETLSDYQAYNELRCINNCIKHSGRVNTKLATFSGWKKGEKLKNLNSAYLRLKPGVDKFLSEFRNNVIKTIA